MSDCQFDTSEEVAATTAEEHRGLWGHPKLFIVDVHYILEH